MYSKLLFVSLAAVSVQGVKFSSVTSFSSSTSSSSSTVDGKTVSSTYDHDDNGFHNDSINGSSGFDNGLHKLSPTESLFEKTHDEMKNGLMTAFNDDFFTGLDAMLGIWFREITGKKENQKTTDFKTSSLFVLYY